VGEGIDRKRVDRQQRIEQVGEAPPVGLREQAKQLTDTVEPLRPNGLGDLRVSLVVPVQDPMATLSVEDS